MAEETLEARAQALFERDPLVAALTVVVAGNHLHDAKVTDVEGRSVMLPDWDVADWGWWLRMCVETSDAIESAKPDTAKPDPELDAMRAAARGMLAGGEVRIEGDHDEIGWLAVAGRVLLAGGRLLGRQAVRAAKWAAPYAKRGAVAAWGAARTLLSSAPAKVVAGVMLLSQSDVATNAVKTAITWAAEMFGHAAKSVIVGLGPLGWLAVAVGAYFLFFRGSGD